MWRKPKGFNFFLFVLLRYISVVGTTVMIIFNFRNIPVEVRRRVISRVIMLTRVLIWIEVLSVGCGLFVRSLHNRCHDWTVGQLGLIIIQSALAISEFSHRRSAKHVDYFTSRSRIAYLRYV